MDYKGCGDDSVMVRVFGANTKVSQYIVSCIDKRHISTQNLVSFCIFSFVVSLTDKDKPLCYNVYMLDEHYIVEGPPVL